MIALIPARGGSKGIPKKNIRQLGDKPLVQWTIEAAMQADLVESVILSTDDDEIADICRPTGSSLAQVTPRLPTHKI